MLDCITGYHHVTSIASDPRRNNAFFCDVLGLRRVKKTVNFDNPSVYHLYYGDSLGTPGSVITYFPFPNRARGRRGIGEVAKVTFSVPHGSLAFWEKRLSEKGVSGISQSPVFSESQLLFEGPDGEAIALCESARGVNSPANHQINSDKAITGLHSVQLCVGSESTIETVLDHLGYEVLSRQSGLTRFRHKIQTEAGYVDVECSGSLAKSVESAGSVHHIAFSVQTEADQERARKSLLREGYKVTEVKDRTYFKAIYFRTEDGILIEIATNPPGFSVDETDITLGNALKLPPQHEHLRNELEKNLVAL